MTIELRAARPADAESLGRMHHRAWVEAYSPLLPESFWATYLVEDRVASWRRWLDDPQPGTTVVVASDDDAIVGHALAGRARDGEGSAYPAARPRELYSMYVLESLYGTGVAGDLLDAVLPPDTPAQLWVFEANPRARRFYEKHGFEPDGARHVFGSDLNYQAEIRMIR